MKTKLEKLMVIISFITSFFTVFVSNGVIIAVPNIAQTFAMTNTVQNWIPTIVVLTMALFTVPAGQICGKIGSKKTFVLGHSLFLVSLLGCIFAFSAESFLFFRFVQGVGGAFANVAEMALIVLAISKESRGKALGIIIGGVYLGTSAAPVICGFLTDLFGWKSIFFVSIPFITFCILMMIFKFDADWITSPDDRFDLIGTLFYMSGIFMFIYGFTELNTVFGAVLTVVGLVVLVVFVLFELRQKTPVLNVNLFRNKPFTYYNIAGLCGYFAVMVLSTIFNYYFQYVKGWSASLTGLILIISPVVMSITAPNSGRLSDRIHPQKIAGIGMALTGIALSILVFVDAGTSIYVVVLAMVLQALGMGLFSGPNMNAIMSSVPQKQAPHASASQLTIRAIGQTMSLGLLTLVFSWVMGDLILSTQYAGMVVTSSKIICGICVIACVVAVITSVLGLRSEPAES